MPLAPCTTESSGREYLVTMRNIQIDIWDLTSGKIIKTVENKIHDWSSHHEGCDIEKRHLVSAKHFVVYAGYRSHQFFIMNIDDPANHTKVDLFEPYKYDKQCDAPDFGNVYREHISTLCIDTNTEYVMVCNGPTRGIHMCSLSDGEQIKVIKGDTSLGKIHSFFFPPCTTDWMYFATKNMVSRISIGWSPPLNSPKYLCTLIDRNKYDLMQLNKKVFQSKIVNKFEHVWEGVPLW